MTNLTTGCIQLPATASNAPHHGLHPRNVHGSRSYDNSDCGARSHDPIRPDATHDDGCFPDYGTAASEGILVFAVRIHLLHSGAVDVLAHDHFLGVQPERCFVGY